MKIDIEIGTINISNNIEENYKMIAFGDSEIEDQIENYLLIQKANSFDEQDKELEMDSYYIEYNGQENSGYGLCSNVILDKNILVFYFDKKTDEDFSQIKLTLNQKKYDENELIEYLKFILSDVLEIKK
ncbi:MAG: Imm10 family immunity protein [Clostridia bacterium]|nr:Imm10 family immunity protein [Clostridia bacterium]